MPGSVGSAGSRGVGSLPIFLFAHSMGGCVGTLFLENCPGYFSGAVLSSPMLRLPFKGTMVWKARALMAVSKLLGWNEKTMPGQKPFDPGAPDFEGSGASSKARFFYQWEIRTSPSSHGAYTMNEGSYRWGRAAWKAAKSVAKHEADIEIPLLVCQAGKDIYVDNEGQNILAKRAMDCRVIAFPEASHEIFACGGAILEKYYAAIFDFYGRLILSSHNNI